VPSAPFVRNESQCEIEGWNDPVRGAVTWRTLLSADRTPTEAIILGVAEVGEADGDVRLHRHEQAEAYYVLSGRGVIQVDGVDHPLTPGTVAFIPGGALHGARGIGAEPLRILYVFAGDSFDQIHYEWPGAESPGTGPSEGPQ
jgi:mannose-6-phosphate isomerase-like protein (cupin superfamily)